MKKRKAKAASRRKATKPPNEKALINECVVYAQSIAAFYDGFKADPDGNNEHAARLGERHRIRAFQALTKIVGTPATTPDGLNSKARIVAFVFRDSESGCLEREGENFLKSFAVDMITFLQPICDGEVTLQKPAAEGGAS